MIFPENINYWHCVHPLWMKAKIYLQKTRREATLNSRVQHLSMLFLSISVLGAEEFPNVHGMHVLYHHMANRLVLEFKNFWRLWNVECTNRPANTSTIYPTSFSSLIFFLHPLPSSFLNKLGKCHGTKLSTSFHHQIYGARRLSWKMKMFRKVAIFQRTK